MSATALRHFTRELERRGLEEGKEGGRGEVERGKVEVVDHLPSNVSCWGLQLLFTARHGGHVGINEIHDVWFVVVREDTCKFSHSSGDGVLEHTVLGNLGIKSVHVSICGLDTGSKP